MPLYKYKSISRDGKILKGNLDASNEADLEKRLGNMKLELIQAKVTHENRALFGQRKVDKTDLINFCIHMGQLTHAGIPILSGLTDLRDSLENSRFKEIVSNLVEAIEGGSTLSEALEGHPTIFDTLFVNLVKAGEISGKSAEIFDSLADMVKWQDELARTTKRLMISPMVVGFVVICVTTFLMVYLVPQLVEFIRNMGEELPLHTRALLATSNFITNFWYIIFSVPIVSFILIRILIKTNTKARYNFDNFKLHLWHIGPVLKKINLSRFANFFSLLHEAGIPVLHSLEISESIIDNKVIQRAISQAREDIEQGIPISTSFNNTGLFPPLVIRMLKIGEATGGLDKALLNVSYFYDRDIKDSIEKLQIMIQPTMTLFVGILLGWVIISVLGPVYSAISNLQF